MLRTLLVPLDGSAFAEHALAMAASVAKANGASLLLARVHEVVAYGELASVGRFERDQRHDETEYLSDMAAWVCAYYGVTARSVLLNEPVAASICDCAERERVDLVVISTHGRTGLKRAWLGSVADGVMRHAPVPVLMLRPGDHPVQTSQEAAVPAHGTLVPLDGSPLAEQVIAPATTLASALGSSLTLLHVVQPVVAPSAEYLMPFAMPMQAEDPEATSAAVEHAQTYLDQVAERVRTSSPSLEVTTLVRVGERAAATILEAAAEHKRDVIAMATHGRGMSRLFLGSVADKVLRGGPRVVLLLRPTPD